MLNSYSLQIRCSCPLDEAPDLYEAEFTSPRTIRVEDILDAIGALTKRKVFQEDLTEELARALGCAVRTTGFHSGVKTVSVAP